MNRQQELFQQYGRGTGTPVGTADYSQYLTPVLNSGADVLILNHYGHDMVNSLPQAVQFGLRDRQANGKNFEIVVPMFSELMAVGAGDAHEADVQLAGSGLSTVCHAPMLGTASRRAASRSHGSSLRKRIAVSKVAPRHTSVAIARPITASQNAE